MDSHLASLQNRGLAYCFASSLTRILVAREIACDFSGFDQVFLWDGPLEITVGGGGGGWCKIFGAWIFF